MVSQPTAVFFLTHWWDLYIQNRFERLVREIGARADVFPLVQRSPQVSAELSKRPPSRRAVGFAPGEIPDLLGYVPFEGPSLVPGSTHFPLLAVARTSRGYERFLVVELDVEFSGNWGDLLEHIETANVDFASSHLRAKPAVPDWYYWSSLTPSDADREWASDPANLRRSFNPIYFLRREALELVDEAHRAGWRGHYECLVPTVLARHGCSTLDLAAAGFCVGADQDWAEDQAEGALSTMRWRPPIKPSEFTARSTGNTLFHPVKGAWYYDGIVLRGDTSIYRGVPDESSGK